MSSWNGRVSMKSISARAPGTLRAPCNTPAYSIWRKHVDAMLRVDLELGRNRVETVGDVRIEDAGVECTREERVVDPEQGIGNGVLLAKNRLVDHHTRVARLQDLQLVARLLREIGENA